jgi:hypothetical protein
MKRASVRLQTQRYRAGLIHKSQRQTFDQIQVHRINVVEPDETLRMVISDHDQMPGVIVKGKQLPKADRPQAGMLFYNDEGRKTGV